MAKRKTFPIRAYRAVWFGAVYILGAAARLTRLARRIQRWAVRRQNRAEERAGSAPERPS